MGDTWPRRIGGHVIDRDVEVRVAADMRIEETFHCIECGRTFEAEPDPETLERLPCDPHPSMEDTGV